MRDIHGYVGTTDYSVVRVLVLVKDMHKIKTKLVVNNPVGGVDGIADVRVVEHWPYVLRCSTGRRPRLHR